MADDQDAEDLRVYLSAYRPFGTDVVVWAKLKHREDITPFDNIPWTLLEQVSGTDNYSVLSNTNDWKEFTYNLPSSVMTGTGGQFAYTTDTGAVFESYKYFAIKIGLVLKNGNTNTAVVPRVADIRSIALQM